MARRKAGKVLAYIYAEALYDAALEAGVLPQVEQEIVAFQESCRREPRLLLFLDSPVISFEEKCRAMRALAQLTQPGFNFLRVLVKRQRVELLEQIVEAFREHCNRKAGLAQVRVDSASELEEPQAARLQRVLEARLARKVVLQRNVRPELLGGMVLNHGGRVWDASLAHHLKRLMEQIGAARSGLGLYREA